jgi:hypothetical protein
VSSPGISVTQLPAKMLILFNRYFYNFHSTYWHHIFSLLFLFAGSFFIKCIDEIIITFSTKKEGLDENPAPFFYPISYEKPNFEELLLQLPDIFKQAYFLI